MSKARGMPRCEKSDRQRRRVATSAAKLTSAADWAHASGRFTQSGRPKRRRAASTTSGAACVSQSRLSGCGTPACWKRRVCRPRSFSSSAAGTLTTLTSCRASTFRARSTSGWRAMEKTAAQCLASKAAGGHWSSLQVCTLWPAACKRTATLSRMAASRSMELGEYCALRPIPQNTFSVMIGGIFLPWQCRRHGQHQESSRRDKPAGAAHRLSGHAASCAFGFVPRSSSVAGWAGRAV